MFLNSIVPFLKIYKNFLIIKKNNEETNLSWFIKFYREEKISFAKYHKTNYHIDHVSWSIFL